MKDSSLLKKLEKFGVPQVTSIYGGNTILEEVVPEPSEGTQDCSTLNIGTGQWDCGEGKIGASNAKGSDLSDTTIEYDRP